MARTGFMGMSRKDALVRLQGLAKQVLEHLELISSDPDSVALAHWKHEPAVGFSRWRVCCVMLAKKPARNGNAKSALGRISSRKRTWFPSPQLQTLLERVFDGARNSLRKAKKRGAYEE